MSDAYYDLEDRIEAALVDVAHQTFSSITRAALHYRVKPRTLQKRVKGGASKTTRYSTNTRLTRAQESSLCEYVDLLDSWDVQARVPHIRGAAEYLLAQTTDPSNPPPPLGPDWVTRFLERHPEYKKRRQQPLSVARKDSYDLETIQIYFQRLRKACEDYGIQEEDIWNMDESGFRVRCGIAHMVITRHVCKKLYMKDPGCRDFVTSVECINPQGRVIPPLLILRGASVLDKFAINNRLPGNYLLGTSESGYNNDKIILDWIKHFDLYSSKGQFGAKRLLILDGAESHFTMPFWQYCTAYDIVLFVLPPNATSWAQPLDVGCFQPLKHYHAEAVDASIRAGVEAFDRLDFLDAIPAIRALAFKPTTVRSAFVKTGIVPWNPNAVLDKIREKIRHHRRTPSPEPVEEQDRLEITPHKPKELVRYQNRMVRTSLNDPSYRIWQQRLSRGIEAQYHRSRLLQRDLAEVHSAKQRKQDTKRIGNTVAAKFGVITVDQVRINYVKRQGNEIQ